LPIIETTASNQILRGYKRHQILFMGGPNMHTTNPRCGIYAILKYIMSAQV